MLTTGVDTIVGTAGRDKISGGVGGTSAQNTFGVEDALDGAGGVDTLQLAINADWGGFTTGSVKNIETLELTNVETTAAARGFVMRNFEGVSTVNVSGPVNITGIPSISTVVNASKVGGAIDFQVAYEPALLAGTSDAVTVGVSGFGRAPAASATTAVRETAPTATTTVVVPGAETLTLNLSGANFIALDDTVASGPSSLKITGAGTARLLNVAPNTKILDASAATGSLDVRLEAQATSMSSIKTGTGDDFIRISGARVSPTATIDGGTGADVIEIGAGVTAAAFTMSGIESLAKRDADALTFSFGNVKDVTKITIANTAADNVTSVFNSMGAIPMAVDFAGNTGTNTFGHAANLDTTGAVTARITTTATAVSAATAQTSNDPLVLPNASSVSFDVPRFGDWTTAAGGGRNVPQNLNATQATSISITGNGNIGANGANVVVIGDAASTLTLRNNHKSANWFIDYSDGVATTAALRTLDLSELGDITLTMTDADLARLETLTVDTQSATGFALSAPLPRISSVTLKGALEATAGVGGSTVAIGDAASLTADVAGLGSGTLANDITLTAQGLEGGLTVNGSIHTGPSRSITIDLSKMAEGNAAIASETDAEIQVALTGTTRTGSITINANGFGGGEDANLSIANGTNGLIQAATVTINADTNAGAGNLALGAITGSTVILNATKAASGAASTYTVGAITAGTLTYNGPEITSRGANVAITSNSDKFSATLNSSIGNDSFVINSARATQESIVVTGNLRGGTDTLTITSETAPATRAQTIDISGLTNVTNLSTTITGGSGADTITGSLGIDSIIGGPGADTINGRGTLANTYSLRSPEETGTIASVSRTTLGVTETVNFVGAYNPVAGDVVSTATLDKIIGFKSSDTIVTNHGDFAINRLFVEDGSVTGVANSSATVVAGGEYFVRGTYSSSANTFILGDTGGDTLLVFHGVTATNTFNGIVLVGYLQTFENDTTAPTGLLGIAA